MSAKELIEEAKRQSEALKTISKWRAAGFVLAAAGAALLYGGLHRSTLRIPFLAADAFPGRISCMIRSAAVFPIVLVIGNKM